ncbi:MAG TPA: thioesterase family protein [Desulfosporosinus sp.]|nr:thioesterase family protein [Desulfosporosinus sp.]
MSEHPFLYETRVSSDWVDYNGHMNDAAYAKVFSLAVDEFINYIKLDEEARSKYAYTIFTLETHVCYLKEALKNEKLLTEVQLLDSDAKRLHLFFTMKNGNLEVIATSEQMLMGMDMLKGKPAPFPQCVEASIEKLRKEHKEKTTPKQARRKIGIKR